MFRLNEEFCIDHSNDDKRCRGRALKKRLKPELCEEDGEQTRVQSNNK